MASNTFGVNITMKDGSQAGTSQKVDASSNAQQEENERRARVNAVWEQMNKGVSTKTPTSIMTKSISTANKTAPKATHGWMATLGMASKRTQTVEEPPQKRPVAVQNGSHDEAKKVAAAALLAVKDAVAAAAAAAAGRGKVEIKEVRDFAGEEIEVKKFIDADSKEAAEKAKAPSGPPSALDSVLEQIKKKPKLNVLDKTKKDWGEFKEENKGVEEELDVYKKSSNQYLDRVSFLQRTDMREFEREREARLAQQSKRRPDTRDD
ncbi:hypothetical protein QJS10_CPB14g01238 [Acorus calamus]|uniref:BCNT-C domain-containing protein n=1 Tax=Acorus calamus TaxID=4465 RepID=A0AAV9DE96_ACOCL|nr:hypothetical protein QJS10_CPB14g01238 [Acorus calamus]